MCRRVRTILFKQEAEAICPRHTTSSLGVSLAVTAETITAWPQPTHTVNKSVHVGGGSVSTRPVNLTDREKNTRVLFENGNQNAGRPQEEHRPRNEAERRGVYRATGVEFL